VAQRDFNRTPGKQGAGCRSECHFQVYAFSRDMFDAEQNLGP
jgi:hypothetical protein